MSHNFKISKYADNRQSMIFKQNRWYLSFFGLYENRDLECFHCTEQKALNFMSQTNKESLYQMCAENIKWIFLVSINRREVIKKSRLQLFSLQVPLSSCERIRSVWHRRESKEREAGNDALWRVGLLSCIDVYKECWRTCLGRWAGVRESKVLAVLWKAWLWPFTKFVFIKELITSGTWSK